MSEREQTKLYEEMQRLVAAHMRGEATDAEILRLEELVAADQEACRVYLDIVDEEISLGLLVGSASELEHMPNDAVPFGESADRETLEVASQRRGLLGILGGAGGVVDRTISWHRHPVRFLGTAAALTFAMWFAWISFISTGVEQQQAGHLKTRGTSPLFVGEIVNSIHASWGAESQVVDLGHHLLAGQRLVLEEGLVEILFTSGARMILEGPAEFELTHDNGGQLSAGRLVARIPPPAIGFRIATKTTTITDLGTEFGVEAATSGEVSIEVYEGSVQVAFGPTPDIRENARTIRVGESVQVSASGTVETKPKQRVKLARELPSLQEMPTVLALDFNDREVAGPNETELKFQEFLLDSTTSPTIRSYGPLTVTVSASGGSRIDDRYRNPFVGGSRFTTHALLRDFLFGPHAAGQGLQVRVDGLAAKQIYEVSIWSYNNITPNAPVESTWHANGKIAQHYSFPGARPPASNNSCRFQFVARADDEGALVLLGEHKAPATYTVYLNGLRIRELTAELAADANNSKPHAPALEPSTPQKK